MTSLLSYSVQALLCASLLAYFCLRRRSLDAYIGAVISFWLIAVILIYAKYGAEQVTFYSNDQAVHLTILNQILPGEGIHFNLGEIISSRYLVTLPVYFFSMIGLNSILLMKFQQLIYLILIYQLGRRFLKLHSITTKWWHIGIFVGPITIFMATLALRDLAIAFFAALFVLEPRPNLKLIGILSTLLLRPHLGVALLIGYILSEMYVYVRPKFFLLTLFLSTIALYWFGTVGYFIGNSILNQVPLGRALRIFTQYKFIRLAANFVGLQFLTLDDSVVSSSTRVLFLSRSIFFDTWLIPLLFIVFVVQHSYQWSQSRLHVFFAFIFFYGLTSQTPWNSSRQNIPFLVVMGLLAVAGIESRRRSSTLGIVR